MTLRITEPGVYLNMPTTDYFVDPCPEPSLTQSIAKVLIEYSPAHARLEHPRLVAATGFTGLIAPIQEDGEEKYDADKAIGSAAHAIITGRGRDLAVGEFDAWRGGDAKEFKTEALKAGRIIVLRKHFERAHEMVQLAREQLHGTEHETAFAPGNGDGEVVLAWAEDDIWLRTMIDWRGRPAPRYYDYKTTGLCCAPHVVEDRPGELGWDVQGAMHQRGLDALEPENIGRREFFFVNQENWPPFALTVVRLSEADLTLGRKKLAVAADMWRTCMATGSWPGYPRSTVLSHPRGWTESQWLEREVRIAEQASRPRRREPMLTDLSGG